MITRALVVVTLFAFSAQAAEPKELPTDAPVLLHVLSGVAEVEDDEGGKGEVKLQPGMYLNSAGATRLNRRFQQEQIARISAEEQNRKLRNAVDDLAKSPPVNWPVVLGVTGGALLIGIGAGLALGFAVKK